MADGIQLLHNEFDVRRLCEDTKLGVVTLFVEATTNEDVVGDNDDFLPQDILVYGSSNSEVENSTVGADVGVVHLIYDSDRTSDPEFHRGMKDIGVSHLRRRMRTTYGSHGEEVKFVAEISVNQENEINNDGGEPNQLMQDDNILGKIGKCPTPPPATRI
ncbi:hypothetical protein LINGRAHAP2_LOCUS23227 [Linum grandiflorum]